jgi:hypothetical protein
MGFHYIPYLIIPQYVLGFTKKKREEYWNPHSSWEKYEDDY